MDGRYGRRRPAGPRRPCRPAGRSGRAGQPGRCRPGRDAAEHPEQTGHGRRAGLELNASLLDGHDSTYFWPAAGKASDADELDGINSTGFGRLSASSTGLISISNGIAAHSCLDYNIPLGGVDPGDVVIVREGAGVTLPAGVLMSTGSVQAGNQVHVRFCNALGSAAPGFSNFPIRGCVQSVTQRLPGPRSRAARAHPRWIASGSHPGCSALNKQGALWSVA